MFPCLKNKKEKQKLQALQDQQNQEASGGNANSSSNGPPTLPPVNTVSRQDDNPDIPKKDSPNASKDPKKSISRKVWNQAFDEIARDDGTKKLAETYAKVIKKSRNKDANEPASDDEDIDGMMNDPDERDRIMREALEAGQQRVYKSTAISNAAGDVANFVLKFKDVIDFAIGNIPQAALPWAGVSIGLSVGETVALLLMIIS